MSSTVQNSDYDASPWPPCGSEFRHPRHGHASGFAPRLNKKKFTGKNEEMQEAIFDIVPSQANKFNKTHRKLHEYVQREMNNGHDADQEIKDFQEPVYNMQLYLSMTKPGPGDTTASIPILEEEKGYAL